MFAHNDRIVKVTMVALLAEGVDRNRSESTFRTRPAVALLAEGVDRNLGWVDDGGEEFVALLAEGVDRNRSKRIRLTGSRCRPPRGGRG